MLQLMQAFLEQTLVTYSVGDAGATPGCVRKLTKYEEGSIFFVILNIPWAPQLVWWSYIPGALPSLNLPLATTKGKNQAQSPHMFACLLFSIKQKLYMHVSRITHPFLPLFLQQKHRTNGVLLYSLSLGNGVRNTDAVGSASANQRAGIQN